MQMQRGKHSLSILATQNQIDHRMKTVSTKKAKAKHMQGMQNANFFLILYP